jgi:GNAT superfamily N-acetyltransferase
MARAARPAIAASPATRRTSCAWTAAPISEYRALEKLRDGQTATIRAIRADDKERVLAAFRALAAQSIYTRFFSMKRELSAEDLRRLTEVDQVREVALVAVSAEERLIGGGRYLSEGGSAEIAFTVAEDYKKLGIATRLLRHLAGIARGNGVARFEAYVLPENEAMLGVFRRSGLPMAADREQGQMRVTLRLDANAVTR